MINKSNKDKAERYKEILFDTLFLTVEFESRTISIKQQCQLIRNVTVLSNRMSCIAMLVILYHCGSQFWMDVISH